MAIHSTVGRGLAKRVLGLAVSLEVSSDASICGGSSIVKPQLSCLPLIQLKLSRLKIGESTKALGCASRVDNRVRIIMSLVEKTSAVQSNAMNTSSLRDRREV